jgi:carbonic anhydrase
VEFLDPTFDTPTAARPGPDRALGELLAGNRRFVERQPRYGHDIASARAVAGGQRPSALVLGCVDSRVPPEAIFDQDFGGICVIRSGGHVLDRAVLGSVEFAVSALEVALVTVLGHRRCGAVQASVEAVRAGARPSGQLGFLVDEIAPDPGAGPEAVTRAHVRRTVDTLRRLEALQGVLSSGALRVVGAEYDLDSGRVEVLD